MPHGAVYGGQAQAGSFAAILGGEKRFEDVHLRFVVHAVSAVAHRKQNVRPGLHVGMARDPRFVQIGIFGVNGQLTAAGHGVACVENQIHDDLFHLRRVGAHISQLRIQVQHQTDIFAEHGRQQFGQLRDQGVKTQHPRLQHLLAAQSQELPRQGRSAVSGLHDFA